MEYLLIVILAISLIGLVAGAIMMYKILENKNDN